MYFKVCEYNIVGSGNVSRAFSLKPELLQKPIITITADSPDPGSSATDLFHHQRQTSQGSIRSEKSDKSETSPINKHSLHQPLHRSATDTEISYNCNEEIEEVPGSVFYIKSNGQLNYEVILKAAHAVANRDCSGRSCGVLLNILNCLIDLGVIEKKRSQKQV